MSVCIVHTACPTHLTVTSQLLDASEKPWCRLTREALQIEAAAVCAVVFMVDVGRNVVKEIVSAVGMQQNVQVFLPL